jgi:hypothetical protein
MILNLILEENCHVSKIRSESCLLAVVLWYVEARQGISCKLDLKPQAK